MHFTIEVVGEASPVDLHHVLQERFGTALRVDRTDSRTGSGPMGTITTAVITAAASGAGTSVAAVIISWLRYRAGACTVSIRNSDGSRAVVSVERVRAMTGAQIRKLVTDVGQQLEHPDAE